MDGAKTATATRSVTDMPREAPVVSLPAVITTMGMMQPLEKLPPYMRCDERPQLEEIIDDLISGECVPKSYMGKDGNPNRGKMRIAIINGREQGYPAQFSIQHQAVINGIPSWYGDVPLGRCYASNLVEDFREWLDEDLDAQGVPQNPTAHCRVKRRGIPTVYEYKFSWKDAEAAGLVVKEGPWQGYWKRMLQFRARTFNIRDAFADVLMGMRVAEEHMSRAQWETSAAGQVIDHVATAPETTAPPRPSRPGAQPEPEAITQAELYLAKDAYGNDTGHYPSGDWLEKGLDYVSRLEPEQASTWFEHNAEVLGDLEEKLGKGPLDELAELKAALDAMAHETAGAEAADAGDKVKPTLQPKPAETTAPPAEAQAPPAAEPDKPKREICAFELVNHKGEVVARPTSTSEWPRALDWIVRTHKAIPVEQQGRLYNFNAKWLKEAWKAGAMNEAQRDLLFPPDELKKLKAPKPAPVPQTPPPAVAKEPKPAETPAPPPAAVPPPPPPAPEPPPVEQNTPIAPVEDPAATQQPAEAAAAPPPVAEKKATRGKEKTPEEIDAKYEIVPVAWRPDMAEGNAFYVAVERDINRLIASRAPAIAFHRLLAVNLPAIDEYAKTNKTFAVILKRTIDTKATVAPKEE